MQTFLRLLTPVVYLFFFVVSFILQQPERQVVKVSQCLTSCRLNRVITNAIAPNLRTIVPSPHSLHPFFCFTRIFVIRDSTLSEVLYHGISNIPCGFHDRFLFNFSRNFPPLPFWHFLYSYIRVASANRIWRWSSVHASHENTNYRQLSGVCLLIPQVALTESGNWQEISPEVIILVVTRLFRVLFLTSRRPNSASLAQSR